MNQYGTQLREQWELIDPAQAQAMGADYFTQQGELAQAQISDLTLQLAGPDDPKETYLEKVGRLNNARMRAAEIVMADLPRPIGTDEEKHRFEIWQEGHPIRQALRAYQRAMDEIDDRTIETDEEKRMQMDDAASEAASMREYLEQANLPTDLIDQCLTAQVVETSTPGTTVEIWQTPPAADRQLEAIILRQWESLPAETRATAWDPSTDGADYYQATQRVMNGLPRF